VKDLTSELDELEEESKRIREEIEKYKGAGNEDSNSKSAQQKDRIEKTEKETQEYDSQYRETMKTINALKIGVQSIFDRIGCNTESVQETLGTHGVTESNMMQYLGIIEQRTNEILQMYSACQSKVI
jgi:predicted  nucleic acid-binding Zn-ribbon protein